MKIGRCPICHSDLHLDALIEDDSGRELLVKLATLSYGVSRHLVNYIGLFRAEKSNLSNSRALKLCNEVLDIYQPSRVLTHALSETVERLRAKRAQGDKKPLSNHSYLASVYKTSQEIFAKSSNVAEREKSQQTGSDTGDSYFMQMQKFGVDVATLNGGKEWLAQNPQFKKGN